MKTIPLFVRGFLLWCGRRYVLAGQLMLMLLAMSSLGCAAAAHLPRSQCDLSLEESGYPSCLAESEPLRSSPEAVNQTRNGQNARYLGQTAGGGSSPKMHPGATKPDGIINARVNESSASPP